MGKTNRETGLQAFGAAAPTPKTVRHASLQAALKYLLSAVSNPNGIGLIQGPVGSGKSTVVRELAQHLARDAAVALVDGSKLKPRRLLTAVLAAFEIETQSETDDELLKMVSEFATEETRRFQPPVIIIDNIDRLYPSALRIVNLFAMLNEDRRNTLRLIATGRDGLPSLLDSDGMRNFSARALGTCTLQPLTAKETMIYLHTRLEAAGGDRAETVFPFDVCDRLRELSGGWPGELNRHALESMQRADEFPVSLEDTRAQPGIEVQERIPVLPTSSAVSRSDQVVEPTVTVTAADQTEADTQVPTLTISRNGELVSEYRFRSNKVLVGRSDFADVIIEDDFVSKLHAVLILYREALVLLDLNSANGITVNSVKVRKTLLRNGDIISLGHHRLRVDNAPAIGRDMEALLKSPDTLRMKHLRDLRREQAKAGLTAVRQKPRRS